LTETVTTSEVCFCFLRKSVVAVSISGALSPASLSGSGLCAFLALVFNSLDSTQAVTILVAGLGSTKVTLGFLTSVDGRTTGIVAALAEGHFEVGRRSGLAEVEMFVAFGLSGNRCTFPVVLAEIHVLGVHGQQAESGGFLGRVNVVFSHGNADKSEDNEELHGFCRGVEAEKDRVKRKKKLSVLSQL